MKQFNKEETIDEYIKIATKLSELYMDEDHRVYNREMKKLYKLILSMKDDIELAQEIFLILMENENILIRKTASVGCLVLNINTEKAKKTLEKIAKNRDNGLIALDAKMALNEWFGYPMF